MKDSRLDPRASLVIVAAGRGERFGNPCKVMEVAGGQPLLAWSLAAAETALTVAEIVVVAGEAGWDSIGQLVGDGKWSKRIRVVLGGSRRQDSVAAGVLATDDESDVVLVHDAARPLAPAALFDACAAAAWAHGAAIAATPISDTLKRVEDNQVRETVSRAELWAAQTPQGFRREMIVPLAAWAQASKSEFTDEASLLESRGTAVYIVPGSRMNMKVTVREDLAMVEALLMLRSTEGFGVET